MHMRFRKLKDTYMVCRIRKTSKGVEAGDKSQQVDGIGVGREECTVLSRKGEYVEQRKGIDE